MGTIPRLALLLCLATACIGTRAATDPLPSWNETAAKTAIKSFVEDATRTGGADFIPVEQRIATFDNDGTLWAEQPLYFEAFFVFDRIRALAPEHPEWKTTEPYKSALAGDMKGLAAAGEQGLAALMIA
ncbi:MAG: hypothetical protein ABWY94_01580, partial [Pseudoxanthomonas sp.]